MQINMSDEFQCEQSCTATPILVLVYNVYQYTLRFQNFVRSITFPVVYLFKVSNPVTRTKHWENVTPAAQASYQCQMMFPNNNGCQIGVSESKGVLLKIYFISTVSKTNVCKHRNTKIFRLKIKVQARSYKHGTIKC